MSSYMIGQITIHDREEYGRYGAGFAETLSGYDGELVVVDEEPTVLEGEWQCTRTVVARFRDEAEARRWYYSDEYQALVQRRFRAAHTNLVMVRGLD